MAGPFDGQKLHFIFLENQKQCSKELTLGLLTEPSKWIFADFLFWIILSYFLLYYLTHPGKQKGHQLTHLGQQKGQQLIQNPGKGIRFQACFMSVQRGYVMLPLRISGTRQAPDVLWGICHPRKSPRKRESGLLKICKCTE